jgi:ribonuclease-3
VTEHLYRNFRSKEEGDLTTMKSLIVSRKVLAYISNDLNLGKYVLLNEAEQKAGGRKRPSIVADAIEAIIGAIYLDGGLEPAVEFIKNNVLIHLDKILSAEHNQNFKSILLEYSQSKSYGLPLYIVKNEQGPDHKKLFTVDVKINDQIMGTGTGKSKKRAEQMAAKDALKKIELI